MRTAKLIGILLAAVLLGAAPLQAAHAARPPAAQEELDRLYDALAASETPQEAAEIEDAIWHIWVRSGSDTVDIIMLRGMEALSQQDYAVALDLFSTAVEIDPDFAEAWNKRATLFYLIDDYDAAMEDIARVMALEPKHFGALAGLAVILDELGEEEAALRAYREAAAIHPHLENVEAAIERLTIEVEGRGI